jgi:hypothetical protein
MYSFYGGIEKQPGRHHPWTVSAQDPQFKYHDFKESPELIREVLEDFKPWERYQAIQLFYEMLEWLNGPESIFETSDCRLAGILPNTQKDNWNKELASHGALVILFRDLKYNLSEDSRAWSNQQIATGANPPSMFQPNNYLMEIAKRSEQFITRTKPTFHWGSIAPYFYNVYYVYGAEDNRDRFGYQLVYRYWAWGNTEKEIMDHLEVVFDALFRCVKELSGEESQWKEMAEKKST